VTHHRARVANASLRGDPAAVEAAQQDLKAAKAERYIREVVDSAPPLSAEQRDRLALLLSGGGLDAA
jgi:hypothetical protein